MKVIILPSIFRASFNNNLPKLVISVHYYSLSTSARPKKSIVVSLVITYILDLSNTIDSNVVVTIVLGNPSAGQGMR